MPRKQMLIFLSDLHLTDRLKGPSVSHSESFDRFWGRIERNRRGAPARLVFVGDLFDIVRSPQWLETEHRPYHAPTPETTAVVDRIVSDILVREEPFLSRIREQVTSGALEVDYLVGNHDRLLQHAPASRRRVRQALTGEDDDALFPTEGVYPDHGVLAHHGHRVDFVNHEPDGGASIGDAIAPELIVRFPREIRARLGEALPTLDDIDDVRPIFAVPSWVRHYAIRRKGILKPVGAAWRELIESFLDNPFTQAWMKRHKKGAVSEGRKLALLFQLSTGRIMRKTKDHRLTQVFRYLQSALDGRFARTAVEMLSSKEHRGLRFVVNGHSHFASMTPLGNLGGQPACYFNTGTWRTVHQMGRVGDSEVGFLPYDAMTYLVFFPEGDPLGRAYEWWTGASVSHRESA